MGQDLSHKVRKEKKMNALSSKELSVPFILRLRLSLPSPISALDQSIAWE